MTSANAARSERATSHGMTPRQRAELDAWKAAQLAKAPRMDEATARRVSAALFGTHAPAAMRSARRDPARKAA